MIINNLILKGAWLDHFKKGMFFISAVFLVFAFVSPANSESIVYDNFDDSFLDVDWDITFRNSKGWTYNEYGSNLNVTNIADPSKNKKWADVILSKTVDPLDDFSVNFNFSWNGQDKKALKSRKSNRKKNNKKVKNSKNATQRVMINLYDTDDNLLSSVGYLDSWTNARGSKSARAGKNSFKSNKNTLPMNGSAFVNIEREGDNIDVFWGEDNIVSGTADTPLGRIDMIFSYNKIKKKNKSSFFGSESVDLVSVEDTSLNNPAVVPEPVAYILFVVGSITFGVRNYWRKRKQKI